MSPTRNIPAQELSPLGERLDRLREEQGISMKEIASLLQMSTTQLRRARRGLSVSDKFTEKIERLLDDRQLPDKTSTLGVEVSDLHRMIAKQMDMLGDLRTEFESLRAEVRASLDHMTYLHWSLTDKTPERRGINPRRMFRSLRKDDRT